MKNIRCFAWWCCMKVHLVHPTQHLQEPEINVRNMWLFISSSIQFIPMLLFSQFISHTIPSGILCWLDIGSMLASIGPILNQHRIPDGIELWIDRSAKWPEFLPIIIHKILPSNTKWVWNKLHSNAKWMRKFTNYACFYQASIDSTESVARQ